MSGVKCVMAFLKIKMDVDALKQELKEVKEELRGIKDDLASGRFSEGERIALRKNMDSLLTEKARLEDKIERAMTPTTSTPVPAPPGNSITLPQVLPLSSIASLTFLMAFLLQNLIVELLITFIYLYIYLPQLYPHQVIL